jgi:ornithine--oxo-acid transaminase
MIEVMRNEGLVARAERLGERLLRALSGLLDRYECVRQVRGKGLMIGIEFGPPRSFKLKAGWNLRGGLRSGRASIASPPRDSRIPATLLWVC